MTMVWFVTGASTGLGKAVAREALARGHKVAAAARDPDDVADLAGAFPEHVLPVTCDVTQKTQIEDAIAATFARFGAIDVLVNNAGYGFLSTIEEASDKQIERQFAVNLFGPIALMRAVLPHMRERKSGFVVNLSSTAGSRGFPGSGYYSATKAALEALTEALAGEAAAFGVRSMIVAPGPFRTDFFGRSVERPGKSIPEYSSIAQTREGYLKTDHQQRGDPDRAARIIVDSVLSPMPPLRLPLGAGAPETICSAYRKKIADIERNASLAAQADFPEGE